ncbi:hypothetical protein MF271_18955 (plasmid) [Deinococcus sp. KNUC1210]|uniref:hypothetical protein n=1 Tax=Deinococcus sp. KNUC1210 TaxID=2917691 RepID=UPI001EEF8BA5|nr:hypothetical protein [Deinococcus sp. KNUC1210]ULH17401.1 hypothetical protein MF271_18955 [Deinococcus sp. KNUC1210]
MTQPAIPLNCRVGRRLEMVEIRPGDWHPVLELTQTELDDLLQYDHTLPTGVVIGKRWKRNVSRWYKDWPWSVGEYTRESGPQHPGETDITWYAVRIVPP